MIVKEIKDINEIKKVLCDKDIYPCIAGDSMPAEEFEPNLKDTFVAGYVDSEIIGILIYTYIGDKLMCHIQVLPEFRKKYAREFARMALEIGEAKNASIYAEIPECYPNVINFAKEFDFKETGRVKAAKKRNGVLQDVIILRRDL